LSCRCHGIPFFAGGASSCKPRAPKRPVGQKGLSAPPRGAPGVLPWAEAVLLDYGLWLPRPVANTPGVWVTASRLADCVAEGLGQSQRKARGTAVFKEIHMCILVETHVPGGWRLTKSKPPSPLNARCKHRRTSC
jgi:hypothetical protein